VETVEVGPFTLVPQRTSLTGPVRQVMLTPVEWQLLVTLLRHAGQVVSRSQLAAEAWGSGCAERHGEVEVYVSRVRRKLVRAGTVGRIETVRGRGYRVRLDARADDG
jgi:DNA-binding response OmpR family regulator